MPDYCINLKVIKMFLKILYDTDFSLLQINLPTGVASLYLFVSVNVHFKIKISYLDLTLFSINIFLCPSVSSCPVLSAALLLHLFLTAIFHSKAVILPFSFFLVCVTNLSNWVHDFFSVVYNTYSKLIFQSKTVFSECSTILPPSPL